MKLELKHLAPYIPYDLKYCRVGKNISTLKEEIKYMGIVSTTGTVHNLNNTLFGDFASMKYLPILRPLSDLRNKELDYWIGLADVTETMTPDYLIKSLIEKYSYSMDFEKYQKVLEYFNENHFDYMSLIEQGLAININTLEK